MSDFFYYSTYPLCQQSIDASQTDYYRVLPRDYERIEIFNKKPVYNKSGRINIDGQPVNLHTGYPALNP